MAQVASLSETAQISIITIGPGENLYDKFGHSALRIYDPQKDIDWAYNYGTYDFNTPNFYTKFARGKLLYKMTVWKFQPFLNNYKEENRWVKEQVLDLSFSEKNALFSFLQNNAKPENSSYIYDFLYDNCATKIRDVLVEVLGEKIVYNADFVKEPYTFRALIQKNVPANSWGSLGMDVAIGAVVDKNATAWEYQFLPEYVFEAATTATLSAKPLVKETQTLYNATPQKESTLFFSTPLFFFSIIALIICWITYQDKKNKTRSRALDVVLFFTTGLTGVLLALLWFATDHSTTVQNYNVLWAFPLSLLLVGLIGRTNPPKWIKQYVFFLLMCLALLVLHSITGVQQYAIGFIPLFIALGIRYTYVFYYLKGK